MTPKHINGSITAIPHDWSSPGPGSGAEFQWSVLAWQYVSMSTQSCTRTILYIVKLEKILILERKIPEPAPPRGLIGELPGIPYGWKEALTTNFY